MQFRIIGGLEVINGNRICTPSAPKVRAVLALLLLRANRVVATSTIFEELWGEHPPKSAATTTQTYIYQLRKVFEREGLAVSGEDLLLTHPPGYILRIDPGLLDANVFARLAAEGRELLEQGRHADAAERLRSALALWNDPVLPDVVAGPFLESHIAHLMELRMRVLELRIQADIRLGRHRELIPELRMLVSAHPLNEWFHARLIDALHRSGRRADALTAYGNLRDVLNRELGLDPAPELQRLQQDVLNGHRMEIAVPAG